MNRQYFSDSKYLQKIKGENFPISKINQNLVKFTQKYP